MNTSEYIIKKKKHNTCTNCGKIGHEFKTCGDAITSFGLINISVSDHTDEMNLIRDKFSMHKKFYLKVTSYKYTNIECYLRDTKKKYDAVHYNIGEDGGVMCKNEYYLKKFSYFKDKIKFLMVSRKFSLGFIEFIRGKYDTTNAQSLEKLFQHMTIDEINLIKNNDYDDILYAYLNKNGESKNVVLSRIYEGKYSTEYAEAKIKFNNLCNIPDNIKSIIPHDLNHYIENIKPAWKGPEWGFPKGRRDRKFEENLSCACREFEEETGMNSSDYTVLNNIEPLEENLIGTNGVSYKHVYYLAMSSNDNIEKYYHFDNYDKNEIGSVKWFSYEEALAAIRPYHYNKQFVLTKVYLFILNQLITKICDVINSN